MRNIKHIGLKLLVIISVGLSGCGGESSSNNITPSLPINSVPIANAGIDQDINTTSLVILNGSLSSDLNSNILTYTWSITSAPTGSNASLSDATVVNPKLSVDIDGSYIVQLIVNDGFINSIADTVIITASTIESVFIPITKEALGKLFFNDKSFSLTRKMSCATCHNPDHAFIDDRNNNISRAVSVGDDGFSLGDRNTPTLNYALYSPDFSFSIDAYQGGQFFDGRAINLIEQAKAPFLNSVEMQMPSESNVIDRVLESNNYIFQMKSLYGENIFDNKSTAFHALADAIATYEASSEFSTFDSKYDRVKTGLETFTNQETQGERLFIEKACNTCHIDAVRPLTNAPKALFTDFRYHNLGVPKNIDVRLANAKGVSFVDNGLTENSNVDINVSGQNGRFKASTLRNIAVTGPYMHNGKFQDLKTVVHFYNTRDVNGAINPETSAPWESSENRFNLLIGVRMGDLGLNTREEDAIVAFMKTLTDKRYENLIN